MTTINAAKNMSEPAWRGPRVAAWLGLAASPTFALMAWIAAADTHRATISSSASGPLPIDGMVWMYLLMSLFHVSPWLKLVSGRLHRRTATQAEGE